MNDPPVPLTPVMIAVLALAMGSCLEHPPPSDFTRSVDDHISVWGSWQLAARQLSATTPALLANLGTARGTRDMEWQNLRGKHRLVHFYRLERRAIPLAARCAWAVLHLPKGRKYATWKDVPAGLPEPKEGDRCPACGCEPASPCTIKLAGGCGEGRCVPAGVHGFKRCSACLPRAA